MILIVYFVGFLISFVINYGALNAFLQARHYKKADRSSWKTKDKEAAISLSWLPSIIWPYGVLMVYFATERYKNGLNFSIESDN